MQWSTGASLAFSVAVNLMLRLDSKKKVKPQSVTFSSFLRELLKSNVAW